MNKTFTILSPRFPHFTFYDWSVWFHGILVPVLPSFSPVMLKAAISNINCTNYQVVWVACHERARLRWSKKLHATVDCMRLSVFALCSVSGLAKVFPAMARHRRQGITDVLLGYLKASDGVINQPGRFVAIDFDMQLLFWACQLTWKCGRLRWEENWLLTPAMCTAENRCLLCGTFANVSLPAFRLQAEKSEWCGMACNQPWSIFQLHNILGAQSLQPLWGKSHIGLLCLFASSICNFLSDIFSVRSGYISESRF